MNKTIASIKNFALCAYLSFPAMSVAGTGSPMADDDSPPATTGTVVLVLIVLFALWLYGKKK